METEERLYFGYFCTPAGWIYLWKHKDNEDLGKKTLTWKSHAHNFSKTTTLRGHLFYIETSFIIKKGWKLCAEIISKTESSCKYNNILGNA